MSKTKKQKLEFSSEETKTIRQAALAKMSKAQNLLSTEKEITGDKRRDVYVPTELDVIQCSISEGIDIWARYMRSIGDQCVSINNIPKVCCIDCESFCTDEGDSQWSAKYFQDSDYYGACLYLNTDLNIGRGEELIRDGREPIRCPLFKKFHYYSSSSWPSSLEDDIPIT